MRVLAVDDCLSIRKIVTYVLKNTDGVSHVHTVDNGHCALKAIQDAHYDLIMVDWSMRPMSGEELIGHIRKLPHSKGVPIIVLSAECQQASKSQAKSLGANGWIAKPFHPDRLRDVLKSYIQPVKLLKA